MQDSLDRASESNSLVWQDTALFHEVPVQEAAPPAVRSLLEGHLLRPADPMLLPEKVDGPVGWAFLIVLLCVVLFALAQRGGEDRPSIMLRAAFDRATSNHLLRYGSGADSLMSVIMMVASILSMALFVTSLAEHFSAEGEVGFTTFLTALVGTVVLGASVRLLYGVLGTVFRVNHLIRAFTIDRTAMVVSTGLLLLPCAAVYHFGPGATAWPALLVGCAAAILFYLKDLQRGMVLLWSDPSVSAAHIFYYFCALKILPLSAAFRLVAAW